MRTIEPNRQHKKFSRELEQAIAREARDMPVEEILALTCQFVGKLIALQDQRKYTSDMIMQLVSENIQIGNKLVLNEFMQKLADAGLTQPNT